MVKILLMGLMIALSYVEIYTQEVEIGFRLEAQGLHRNYSFSNPDFALFPLPTCIQFNLGFSPISNFWIDLRGGKEFAYDDFTGMEFGIFGRYFFSKIIYLTAGFAGHSNEGAGGMTSGSFSKRIYMPAAGIGLRPWNHIGFDLIFQKVNNVSISWTSTYQVIDSKPQEVSSITKVDWLVKLGLTFYWNL